MRPLPIRQTAAVFILAGAILCLWLSGTLLTGAGTDRVMPLRVASAVAAPTPKKAKPETPGDNARPPLRGDAGLLGEFSLDAVKRVEDHYRVPLKEGGHARLTLSPDVQASAEAVLERAKAPMGAVVALDLDGRVLALAGRRGGSKKPARDLPLKVWAPAASVFKVVTAAALLRRGVPTRSKICYRGGLRAVEAEHLRDNPDDNECDDLVSALAKSVNPVFAKLAHRHLEPSLLSREAQILGLASAPSFSVPVESGRIQIPKTPLEFARVAAGFWRTEISPLTGALVAATVASDGRRVTPRLVDQVHHPDGSVQKVKSVQGPRVLPPKIAEELTEMMVATVSEGTAHRGFHDPKGVPFLGDVEVAGKTGSLTRATPYLAYSWFVGFAPADDPKVVVAVLLGNPEKWHLKAHTAARMVLQAAL